MCLETPDCRVEQRVRHLGEIEPAPHGLADDAQLLEVHRAAPAVVAALSRFEQAQVRGQQAHGLSFRETEGGRCVARDLTSVLARAPLTPSARRAR